MDTTQWPQGPGGKKKARPHKEQAALSCPRCSSTNTKFCYYNNYSLTQPRYFCKTCRRYWTEGGCLRNVPVGGGSRKHRRPSSNISSPSNPKIRLQDHYTNNIGMSQYMALPFDPRNPNFTNSSTLPVMELFKGIGSNPIYGSSSGFHDFKTTLGNNLNNNNNIFPKQSQVSDGDQQFEMQGEAGNIGGFWNGMLTGGASSW